MANTLGRSESNTYFVEFLRGISLTYHANNKYFLSSDFSARKDFLSQKGYWF